MKPKNQTVERVQRNCLHRSFGGGGGGGGGSVGLD